MDKLKGMLKISERDKKLLVVVLAVLIMALAYFFGFQNLSDQVDTLSTKKTTLETTQRDLKEKNNNKQKYVNDTMNYLKQYDNLLDRYAAGSTQPNSIDFFNMLMEKAIILLILPAISQLLILLMSQIIASGRILLNMSIHMLIRAQLMLYLHLIMRQQVLSQVQHLFHFIQLKVESVIIRNHHLMLRQEQEIYSQQLHQLSNKRIQGEGYEII